MAEAVRGRRVVGPALLVGLVATIAVVALPTVPLVVRSPALQAVVETAGGLAILAAALIVYGRFRQHPTLALGSLLAGLLTFGLTNLLLGAVPAAAPGLGEAFDTWAALLARFIATILFTAAAVLPDHRTIPRWSPVAAAGAILAATTAGVGLARDRLPPAVDLSAPITQVTDLTAHPVVVTVNLIGLLLFLLAAVGFLRRTDDPLYQDLAGASTLAAFSRLHIALVPSLYSGAVYSGDLFRLAFHTAVLLAAVGEITRYWSDREALAVADERRRVARELHDGLAQEVAFIATTAARMSRRSDDADTALIASAARRALDESRRAIATLTRPLDEPLAKALADTISELANRTGGTVELDLDPDATVEPVVREELLRIAREAVSNSLRHAGAESTRVRLQQDGRLALEISDTGDGFDPEQPGNAYGFGLTSMRERAQALGAHFELISQPGDGTTVKVVL